LLLGDNIFSGSGFAQFIRQDTAPEGAAIFAAPVNDRERYGVLDFDSARKAVSIGEKPANPKSKYAVPALYFYDSEVVEIPAYPDSTPAHSLRLTRHLPSSASSRNAKTRRQQASRKSHVSRNSSTTFNKVCQSLQKTALANTSSASP
jgi:dTDP-glucose pyrophosphorylase